MYIVGSMCMCYFFQLDMEKIKEKLLKVSEVLTALLSVFGPRCYRSGGGTIVATPFSRF